MQQKASLIRLHMKARLIWHSLCAEWVGIYCEMCFKLFKGFRSCCALEFLSYNYRQRKCTVMDLIDNLFATLRRFLYSFLLGRPCFPVAFVYLKKFQLH